MVSLIITTLVSSLSGWGYTMDTLPGVMALSSLAASKTDLTVIWGGVVTDKDDDPIIRGDVSL